MPISRKRSRRVVVVPLVFIFIGFRFLLQEIGLSVSSTKNYPRQSLNLKSTSAIDPAIQSVTDGASNHAAIGPFMRHQSWYLLSISALTSDLLANNTAAATEYYQKALNEERAEIWLHRALSKLGSEHGRTLDPTVADVFLIPSYLHFHRHLKVYAHQVLSDLIAAAIIDRTKPHVLLTPTHNPSVSIAIGLRHIAQRLRATNVQLWSVGFEINSFWQPVALHCIIPIPYVVSVQDKMAEDKSPRAQGSVFYVGDRRRHAKQWSGCDRSMLQPLVEASNRNDSTILVHLTSKRDASRWSENSYTAAVRRSEYCLIMCGDTPTSRSLTTALVHGCIPVLVGNRWHGLCEMPCHAGWGWNVANASHLPFPGIFPWHLVPVINEAAFALQPDVVLQRMLAEIDVKRKHALHVAIHGLRRAFVYGFGDDAVTSTQFGNVAELSVRDILQRVVSAGAGKC